MQRRLSRLLPHGLGAQLQLVVLLVLWLTIGLFGAHTIRQQSALALANLESQAGAIARNIALASESPILNDKLDVIEDLLLQTADYPHVHEVRVLDAEGLTLSAVMREVGQPATVEFGAPASTERPPAQTLPQLRHNAPSATIVAWHPIVAGNLLGWVRLEHSTDSLRTIQQQLWLSTVAACLLAGLGSAALITWLLRTPLRALRDAHDFAVELTRNEGQQLEALQGPEETRALSRALNKAATRLHRQRQEIDAGIAALQQHEAALADTNEQLRTIFALSPDALVSFDAAGCIRFANDAFFRITGLSPAQVLNQAGDVLDAHLRRHCQDPAQYPGLAAYFPAPNAALPARPQLTLRWPDQRVLEVIGQFSQAASVHQVLYLRDITHENAVDRMKSEFLSTAAHELRTPMTSILGCAELLMTRDFEAPRRQHLVGIVHRQSEAMVAIVDELLDLSRIESRGDAEFDYQAAELGELVLQAVADFVPPAGRAAPVLVGLDASAPVRADRGKFGQVMRNLLSNAYKYSPHGGSVEVRLLASLPDPQDSATDTGVGVKVTDKGIGMTPDQMARVCERFYRADASGQIPGTGLGMSIVKEIVTLMDGQLDLASQPGCGSEFTVRLRRAQPLPTQRRDQPTAARLEQGMVGA